MISLLLIILILILIVKQVKFTPSHQNRRVDAGKNLLTPTGVNLTERSRSYPILTHSFRKGNVHSSPSTKFYFSPAGVVKCICNPNRDYSKQLAIQGTSTIRAGLNLQCCCTCTTVYSEQRYGRYSKGGFHFIAPLF